MRQYTWLKVLVELFVRHIKHLVEKLLRCLEDVDVILPQLHKVETWTKPGLILSWRLGIFFRKDTQELAEVSILFC